MESKRKNYMIENHNDFYEDEIDLKEIFLILWRNKIKIGSIALVFMIIGFVTGNINNIKSKKAVAVIEYNYPGIEKGKTPEGDSLGPTYQKFKNIFMVKQIFKEMPELSKKNLSEDDILAAIKISPVIPKDLKKEEIYYPNKFILSFKGTPSTKQNETILKTFLEVNKNFLKNNYTNKILLPKIDYSYIKSYDFKDEITILNSSLTAAISISTALNKELIDFQYKAKLQTLIKDLELLKNIDLVRVNNIIEDYKMTKSPETLELFYKQQLEKLEKNKEVVLNDISELEKMIKKYKPENKEILLLNNSTNSKIRTNEEDYYTEFLRELSRERLTLSKINSEINYIHKKMIQPLNTNDDKDYKLEEKIKNIVKSTNENIDSINNLIDISYNQKYSNLVQIIKPVTTESSGKTMLITLIALILGLGFGTFYVLVANYIFEEKKNKKNN